MCLHTYCSAHLVLRRSLIGSRIYPTNVFLFRSIHCSHRPSNWARQRLEKLRLWTDLPRSSGNKQLMYYLCFLLTLFGFARWTQIQRPLGTQTQEKAMIYWQIMLTAQRYCRTKMVMEVNRQIAERQGQCIGKTWTNSGCFHYTQSKHQLKNREPSMWYNLGRRTQRACEHHSY